MLKESQTPKNQAPNMYVNWDYSGNYDLIMVDWYCEKSVSGTYWAVHNWSGGYAGFQCAEDKHNILLSIWNDGELLPEIEYVSAMGDMKNLDFGGEGEGKHIFTNYPWEVGKWYTMCIGTKTMNGKTYYAQWIREENSDEWFLTAIISFPKPNRMLNSGSMFQEDFAFNGNEMRRCRLRNAYGRYAGTNNWCSWAKNKITNAYFPYKETTWDDVQWNVTVNCNWGVGSNNSYVWVQSGGDTPDNGKKAPPITYTLTQSGTPSTYPSWTTILPKYLRNEYSNLYAVPSGSQVVQSETPYYWNFIDSNDGYLQIATSDNSKAISLSGTADGSDVVLEAFNGSSNNQKWNTYNAGKNLLCYIKPKTAPNMNMDVEGPYMSEGTPIQIWTHNTTAKQFKWSVCSTVEMKSIKSNFSNLFVVPSGSNIVQSSRQYCWNFISTSDGYFYILTLDNTKAVSLSGTYDGADLVLTDFNPASEMQKWKKTSAGSNLYYFIPKAAPTMNMDIEGPSYSEGTAIQIWTHNATASQFKWFVIDCT